MTKNIDINASGFDRRLLVLAAASFAMGTEAYVYVGHLGSLCAELDIGLSEAGMLAASFAVTYALAAPVVATFTARTDRRLLIWLGLVGIGLFNLAAAVAPSFAVLLTLRIACGLAAALVGPASSAAAAAMVAPERRGRAMAAVLAGMTLAFVLGIPLGSVIGAGFGWRATFAFAGLLAIAAALLVRLILPRVAGDPVAGLRRLAIGVRPDIARTLALTVIGFAATFTLIAYIAPVAARIADIQGAGVGGLQALIGMGSIIGIVTGARNADGPRPMRMIAISFVGSALALSAYSLLAIGDPHHPATRILLGLAMVTGAAALFARTPIIQARLVRQAPESTGVLLALHGSMVFVGQGLGAAAGAMVLAVADVATLGYAAAGLAVVGIFATLSTSVRPAISPIPQRSSP